MIPLELIHFNDVYNVSQKKEGGASRFASVVHKIREESTQSPLLLFSGDAFNPSLEGTITRGSHMPGILNQFGITAACVGNHDFDFGMPQLVKLIQATQFPWLLSNVLDKENTEDVLKRYLVVACSGLRIGFVGLVEEEWIETIPSFPPELKYHDFIQVAKDLSKELRDPKGPHHVDLVVAITHMRVPNDIRLAKQCKEEIDLVLGGHDHFYFISKSIPIVGEHWTREQNLDDVGFDPEEEEEEGVRVVKSGTDFRELSYLKLEINDTGDKKYIQSMTAERVVVGSDVEKEPETEALIEKVAALVSQKTSTAIGYTTVPLDGRSMAVRTEETNFGNFTADLMKLYYSSLSTPVEVGFCVGGTIRNDSIIPAGEITLGHIITAFPFLDPVVVIRLSGQNLWDALENSVSEYPKQEGRFPQLSGLRLEWNPGNAPGERVRKVSTSDGAPLDMNRKYIVATRAYLIGGYDGYTALKVPKEDILVDEEAGVLISTIYRKFFLGSKYINAIREYHAEHGHKRIQDLVIQAANKWRKATFDSHAECQCDSHDINPDHISSKEGINEALHSSDEGHPECIKSEDDEEEEDYMRDDTKWVKRWANISPKVEGRIVRVGY
ncbi:Metallo-dependent phosphatase-like protein [Pilobolus umbonatus]|nr:Metallo-dependent phosphatase-like protein [Pilobolus umbonatus]